ncbi:MAG TPA: S41 family peptidase [Gemmatimonadaceae bacterium]|nr:S41 family peptidase [Gemmatimonadaceae bacterium]
MPTRTLTFLGAVLACACATQPQPRRQNPAAVATPLSAAATACITDFDTLYSIVTRDYSGYQDRMRENGRRIALVADSVRTAIRTVTTDSACTATVTRWTALFREHDHHFQFWQLRQESTPAAASASGPAVDPRRPTIQFIDDSTAVITVRDLNRRYKPAIDSLIDTNRTRLLATPYLVVDFRRNGGGATAAYRSIMELIYTDPIAREGFDVWISPRTIAAARPYLDAPDVDSAMKAEMWSAIRRYETTGKPFFHEGKGGDLRYDSVYSMPRAVAVLTGRGCASSCEQFVIDAMYSTKVTVFGTEHTAGMLDYGNIAYTTLPSGLRRLGTATTRSRRLPGRPMDKTGVVPQVLIPKDEQDPIRFAIDYITRAS